MLKLVNTLTPEADNLRNTPPRQIALVTGFSLLYLLLMWLLIGFKTDQLIIVLFFNTLFYWSNGARRFVMGFLIFMIFWIIFDSMKAFPNYNVNPIHIKELYFTEKKLFSVEDQGQQVTLNEFAQKHHATFFDVMAGLFYINWVPVPLIFSFWLFRKNKAEYLRFSLAFLFVNLIGFLVYYLYPAAPPWYVQQYGFEPVFNTPGNTGGLARFDAFFGIDLFHSMYAKSSNVFAAMPSLHSSYPVVVLFYGLRNRLGRVNIFFAIFMLGIWFSAIYSGHHYLLDVLAGAGCAVTGLFIFETVLLKQSWFRRFLYKYQRVLTR